MGDIHGIFPSYYYCYWMLDRGGVKRFGGLDKLCDTTSQGKLQLRETIEGISN